MADESVEPVQQVLELEKPNMDEQSAAPKEPVVEPEKKESAVEPEKKEEPLAETKIEEQPEAEDWRSKELRRKHAQIKERDRKLEEQAKEIEALRQLAERAPPKEGEEPVKLRQSAPAMSDAQIQAAAQALREQE